MSHWGADLSPELVELSFPISAGSPSHGIDRNFELRTLGVVTLRFVRPTPACFSQHFVNLCATSPLAALFEPKRNWLRFSKPVRQFVRIETDCASQSKGWE